MNIKDHLISRHIDLELHQPILDYENCAATFLCWNFSGKICGYQKYRPLGEKKIFNDPRLGKYYTYRNKNYPTVVVWGLETYYNSDGPIFITEGIFDAARLTKRGYTAFATMTSTPPIDYKNWFKTFTRPTVAVCDNDISGLNLARYTKYSAIVPKEYGDLGDSPEDYVSYLINQYAS